MCLLFRELWKNLFNEFVEGEREKRGRGKERKREKRRHGERGREGDGGERVG